MKTNSTPKPRLASAFLVILVSALVHIWLLLASKLFPEAIAFGDLSLYNYWVFQVQQGEPLYGVARDWVYPALAFLPMWLTKLLPVMDYEISWLVLIFMLNTIAAVLLSAIYTAKQNLLSYFYLGAVFLLGPVAVSRIDAVSVALAIIGILAVHKNANGMAAAIFTIAGWMKVWPVALFLAMISAFQKRIKPFLVASAISLTIIAGSIALSSNAAVLSFVSSQQERGIQIEAVIATPFLWLAKFGFGEIYFDQAWLTNQVQSAATDMVAGLANLALFIALGITALLAIKASQRGVDRGIVFALASFTGVLDLIVFNKVGSPQFMLWLLVPAIALMVFQVSRTTFALAGVAAVLALTQLIYPILYIDLLGLNELPLIAITLRNGLLVALLIWANSRLMTEKALK